jgi:hypothetical protein
MNFTCTQDWHVNFTCTRDTCARKRPFTSARDAWMRLAATFHYRL